MVGGRFHIEGILIANKAFTEKKDRLEMVQISVKMKRELWWWCTLLVVCAKRTKYPDPSQHLPAWSRDGYTDAAGGTSLYLGAGCGAVMDTRYRVKPVGFRIFPRVWVCMPFDIDRSRA